MAREAMTNKSAPRAWAFRLMAAVIPLAVLVIAEVVLRLFGVGSDARKPFAPVEGRPEYVALSPDFGRRYFQGFTPGIAFNPFLPEKPDSTFRVFALGGSSTAGFPYSFYYGFPARLQDRLESFLPDMRIEVINLGMTAVNSYTLWHLKDYLLKYEPDAIAIYAGHNEYYGAFGAGSTMYSLGNRIWLKRLTLRLKSFAVYSLLEGLIVRPPAGADAVAARGRTLMAQVVGNRSILYEDEVFRAGVRQFESNMEEVIETFTDADVPVYVATLTSNLRSQPPLGESVEARQEFEEAEKLLRSDPSAARERFARAKDLDEIRFRAPEDMNEVIRRLTDESGTTRVDVRSRFVGRAPDGVEGEEQFVDHLHPTYEGYDDMADAFFDAIVEHPRLSGLYRQQAGVGAAAIDPIDRVSAEIQVIRLKSGFPFTKDVEPEQELRLYTRLLDRFSRSGRDTDSLAVLALNQVRPIYDLLYEGVRMARARADTLDALLMYRALLEWQPFNHELNKEAVQYALGSPNWNEWIAALALAVYNRNGGSDFLDALAAIRMRQEHLQDAEHLLDAVERQNPDSRTMLYNKARLHIMQGDTARARDYFARLQRAVRADRGGG